MTSAQDTQLAGVQYSAPDFCRSPGAAGHYPGVRFRMDEQGAVLQRLSARQQLFPEHRICRPQPARRSRAGPADADEKRTAPGALQPGLPAAGLPRRWLRPRKLTQSRRPAQCGGLDAEEPAPGQRRHRQAAAALSYCCRPEAMTSWVLPFQHNLQRLGIVMDIRQVDNSQYSNRTPQPGLRHDAKPVARHALAGDRPANLLGVRLYSTPPTTRRGVQSPVDGCADCANCRRAGR